MRLWFMKQIILCLWHPKVFQTDSIPIRNNSAHLWWRTWYHRWGPTPKPRISAFLRHCLAWCKLVVIDWPSKDFSLYRAWLLAVSQRRPLQQTLTAFVERAARKYHRSMTVRGNFCKSSAGAGKGYRVKNKPESHQSVILCAYCVVIRTSLSIQSMKSGVFGTSWRSDR